MKKRLPAIAKNVVCSLFLPVCVFLIFLIIARSKGKTNYGDLYTWKMIFTNASISVCLACVLGLNLKNGRMDLSSGANLILTAIVALNLTKAVGGNGLVLLAFCVLFGVIFSLLTATVYITLKMPMVITAIAMVLLYESLTKIVGGGAGANIVSTSSLNYWGYIPYAYILGVIALVIYTVVTRFSIIGYRSDAIANNQQVAVSIGINEKKTVFAIFGFSGIILGLGAAIYLSGNIISAQSNLESVRIVYSNFMSIIIGLYLARYSNDAIGILIGALTIAIMRYSMNLMGWSDMENIVIGIFIILFSIFTNNQDAMVSLIKKNLKEKVA